MNNFIQLGLPILLGALTLSAQTTIKDGFTDTSNWGAPTTQGGAISIGSGRMNYTSDMTDISFASIPRNAPLLPTTQDWSLQVNVHIDPFTLTTENQFSDVFLEIGKTGDWANTHVAFEFGRGQWGSHIGYYIFDDVKIQDVEKELFSAYNLSLASAEPALRMDYSASQSTIIHYFAADGINWVAQGIATLASGTNDFGIGATNTFTILLGGASQYQTVSAGQAYFTNLVITVTSPPPCTFTITNGAITITGYTGAGNVVSLPSAIDGMPVRSIGDNAFANCLGLTNVIIPNSITNIGNRAFANCYGLTNVAIPGSVICIGEFAFAGCYRLTGVTIPNGITSIAEGTFMEVNMKNIAIPNSVTSIGDSAFSDCYSLTNVTIPDSVTNIGAWVFWNCYGLTSITIPDSVTSIGESAFGDCTALTCVFFQGDAPNLSLESPWSPVFYNDGVSYSMGATIFYLSGTTGWGATFDGCPSVMLDSQNPTLLNVTMGPLDGLRSTRGQWQVDGGTLLNNGATVAGLSVGIHTVSFGAISGWIPPASQTIFVSTNAITTIKAVYTKATTGSLCVTISPAEAISAGAQWKVDGGIMQGSGATVAGIPVGFHTVEFSAISGWISPASGSILVSGNTLTTVSGLYTQSQYPFAFMTNDDDITLTITGYTGPDNNVVIPSSINGLTVTSIGANAFGLCYGLNIVTIPDNVTSIGSAAFDFCSSLTNVTIGKSVASIGDNAFFYCTALTGVIIPNSVTNIGYDAFGSCSGLTNVTFGNSVITIEAYAFAECTGLTCITIPNSVTSIGDWAFADCYGLTNVYFQGNTPGDGSNSLVFDGDPNTVYYLDGTTGWGETFDGRPTALWTPAPTLAVKYATPSIVLTWSSGVLIESTNLTGGVWTTNAVAQSPYTVAPNGLQKFYRVKVN